MNSAKTLIYILLAILAGLIIYIIVTATKGSGSPAPKNNPNKPVDNTTTPAESDASKAGVDTTVPPTTVQHTTLNPGDKIYSGGNIQNAYTSCTISSSNIWATYSKGDYIGTYLRNDGNCVVVDAPQVAFGFFPAGTKEVYLLFNANIFVKNA